MSDMSLWRGRAFVVRFSHTQDHGVAFVFLCELASADAAAFHEETGVWPIHTVDGKLLATRPVQTPARKARR